MAKSVLHQPSTLSSGLNALSGAFSGMAQGDVTNREFSQQDRALDLQERAVANQEDRTKQQGEQFDKDMQFRLTQLQQMRDENKLSREQRERLFQMEQKFMMQRQQAQLAQQERSSRRSAGVQLQGIQQRAKLEKERLDIMRQEKFGNRMSALQMTDSILGAFPDALTNGVEFEKAALALAQQMTGPRTWNEGLIEDATKQEALSLARQRLSNHSIDKANFLQDTEQMLITQAFAREGISASQGLSSVDLTQVFNFQEANEFGMPTINQSFLNPVAFGAYEDVMDVIAQTQTLVAQSTLAGTNMAGIDQQIQAKEKELNGLLRRISRSGVNQQISRAIEDQALESFDNALNVALEPHLAESLVNTAPGAE